MVRGIGIWYFFNEEERKRVNPESFSRGWVTIRDTDGFCPLGQAIVHPKAPEPTDVLNWLVANGRVDANNQDLCRFVLKSAARFIHSWDDGYIGADALPILTGQIETNYTAPTEREEPSC